LIVHSNKAVARARLRRTQALVHREAVTEYRRGRPPALGALHPFGQTVGRGSDKCADWLWPPVRSRAPYPLLGGKAKRTAISPPCLRTQSSDQPRPDANTRHLAAFGKFACTALAQSL